MRRKQPQSLGALVDSIAFSDLDDEELDNGSASTYGDEIAEMEMAMSLLGSKLVISENGTSSSEASPVESARNSDYFPSLQENTSAELLSDMKRGAMMTHSGIEKASVMMSFSKGSAITKREVAAELVEGPTPRVSLVDACDGELLKYHRTNSIALSGDASSVCADFGKWM
jgi:hypothetical protein